MKKETIFENVFFEPIAIAAAQGQKALAEGVDIMVERDNTIYAIAVKSGTRIFNADSRKKQEQNFMAAGKDFWTELTEDEEFYIKLIRFMDKLPEEICGRIRCFLSESFQPTHS